MRGLPGDRPRGLHLHAERQVPLQGDIPGVCPHLQGANRHPAPLGHQVRAAKIKIPYVMLGTFQETMQGSVSQLR